MTSLSNSSLYQASEWRLKQLNRLYAFLRQTSQAILRTQTRSELFREVCRVAVEHGQCSMAWIGTLEGESGLLKPVAWWNRECGPLPDPRIQAASRPKTSSPSMSVLREGRRFVCNDIAGDPRLLPWREQVLARGCLSIAAVPIKAAEKVVGAFSVYSEVPNFFDDETLALLDDVTGDISFALHTLDQEEQRWNAEAEVRRFVEDLEARVLEQTRKLDEINDRLAKQNEEFAQASCMRNQILARMSHDFRTPLNSIIGFTDLLEEQAEGPLGGVYADYVRHVREGARHLLGLVNDVLDLSRIEAGRIDLRYEEFSAADATAEVVAVIAPLAEAKHIELRSELSPKLMVFADQTRFKQTLFNLLSNAVKFTPPGGRANVTAQVGRGEIRFCVTDTGIGIAREHLSAIFEEFMQVALRGNGMEEGTGLGLTISKHIVELHGGRIWVESSPGEGSRFFFTMLAADSGEHRFEQQASSAAERACYSATRLIA